MTLRWFLLPALLLLPSTWLEVGTLPQGAPAAPLIDGRMAPGEWEGATSMTLSNGGTAHAMRSGTWLHIAVESPIGGFANVCVAGDRRVRILHASAALGDLLYEREGTRWSRKSEFEWVLRDSPRQPAPTPEQKQAHLAGRGWLANASLRPTLVREFTVRISGEDRFVAVTFVETAAGSAVAYAPASVADDCRDTKLAQGFAPAAASFAPGGWLPIEKTAGR